MKSFLRAAEVWRPTDDGQSLVFEEGFYGHLREFEEVSARTRFAFDEGLPGKAWAQRHPVILKSFQNSYFKRTAVAEAAGLTCGVALPIFAGAALKAVVVFFCGDDDDHVGALEVWKHDPQIDPGMKLDDGYFGIAEAFEWRARHTAFMRGFGLPGIVWAQRKPVFLPDLGSGFRFLRPDDARKVGINKGLGIPCPGDAGKVWVMTFLSALGTPIALRYEIWSPNADGSKLIFSAGDCARNPDLENSFKDIVIKRDEGTIGKVWRTGLPAVNSSVADDSSQVGQSATLARLSTIIALPIYDESEVISIVCMYC